MNETKLLRICLLVAALGIVSLFFLSENLEAKEIEISLITPDYVGQTVSISGTVSKISLGDGMTFITLEDDGELFPVVFFQEIEDVFSGEDVLVSGKVQEYKGRLQIVGEKYLYRDS
ncbi:OB-fold nucleic acid binding domain-containing protein [Candidatus Woesearchaeota archaeon]|nr:OB-fold nucleic acid binding domain-containing protein [Candidatus Woesearchaeota archaeon]